MKLLRSLIILSIAGEMLTACGDEPEVTVSLKLSKRELILNKTAQSKVVTITTSESWVAETPADWLLVSPSSGDGTETVTVSVTENDQDGARESYVKITTKSKAMQLVVLQSTNENGAIQTPFSVSADKQVYFSQGNLQYQARTGTWRFAENQWDYVGTQTPDDNGHYGGTIKGSDNANISSTYDGWIDLFGWATSGWNSGANEYQPYSTSTISTDYYVGGEKINNLTGEFANADWGVYNKINNAGNQAGLWRTLTDEEWMYLLYDRDDAILLKGSATVNGITGIILLPDNWKAQEGITFKSGTNGYDDNIYTIVDWCRMEAYGAVFFPAVGIRNGLDVEDVGYFGSYWSSSAFDNYTYYMYFFSDYLGMDGYENRYEGRSVRLVRDL